MNAIIHPGLLRGEITVPASKSMAHRTLIAAALADGLTTIHLNVLSDDIEATLFALTALGATIDYDPRRGLMPVRPIEGAPNLSRTLTGLFGKAMSRVDYGDTLEVDCGESGSTLRFLLPVACALGVKARFIGRGRLPQRPMSDLTDALRAHGAEIDSNALPIQVSGSLRGGLWTLPGNVSSQYVTGLLLALPLLEEDSEIRLTSPLQSAAYVDMTLEPLSDFGIRAQRLPKGFFIPGGQAYRSPEDVYVEGDWSAAAFWHAANALGSTIDVLGVSRRSIQGDRAVMELLGKPRIDVRNVPDLAPVLAAVAAALPQRTEITGAARLRLKESDRLQATADMINALGGDCRVTGDGLVIEGGQALTGGTVDGANDHRIVMAAAILATRASGDVRILGAEAVSKSYPDFFEHFRRLGGNADVEPAGR